MESPVKPSKESKKGLVLDLNNMEHVNMQLKGKLKMLTVEMKDAVERMNAMAVEIDTIKNDNFSHKGRVAELEQENALLVSQVDEMVNERAERDAIIEEFGTAVEARIIEWKNILDEKDSVIVKLKENLMYATTDRFANASPDERNHAEIERLIQDIDRRDEIIAELQSKLSDAVVEINESSLLIEKFKSDSKGKDTSKRVTKGQRQVNNKLQDASKRICTLESLLECAERDARVKSEQLCETLSILNKYEDEDTSLTKALKEVQELKGQLEKKNQHIGDLVDVVNRLENENSRFEDAIIVLREKLEIIEDEESTVDELILQRQRTQEGKFQEIQRNCDRQTSENVQLKFQIRKLKTALKESIKIKPTGTHETSSDGENIENFNHRSQSKVEHVELKKIRENVKWMIEENEALRQGMHEILDCIHNQDGKSIITIQSRTLENLLEALDARHLAGWYHPAMRLQGRVNYLQGSNAELRAQIQQIRKNQLLLLEPESQQRSSSVEEGECSQQQNSASSKIELQPALNQSRNVTPKSSENADSGRASSKPLDIDEIHRVDDEPSESCDTPLDDEGFGKKSEEVYAMAKEMIAQESDFKKTINDAEQRQKILEAQIIVLKKNLASYVSPEAHAELRQRYLQVNMQLRAVFESKFSVRDEESIEALTNKSIQELREELISLHKQLSDLALSSVRSNSTDVRTLAELEGRLAELKAENERLKKAGEIAHEEALIHRAIDSTVLNEFNDLRQKILKFELNDEKDMQETARLSFELANHRVIVTELREQKKILKRELIKAKEDLADLSGEKESEGQIVEQINRPTDNGDYIDIIEFLQRQYAGSTSLSAWERYEAAMNKLNNDRNEVKELIAQISSQNENLKIQHEMLTARLQIVEQLKDMLEQQIGSNDVQEIIQRFTIDTRQVLSESKYKAQISQLEDEIRRANVKLSDYEKKVASMEKEEKNVQRAWKVQKASSLRRATSIDKATEIEFKSEKNSTTKQMEDKFVQTALKVLPAETQCSLCCEIAMKDNHVEKKESVKGSEIDDKTQESKDSLKTANLELLQEQLNQALTLASERSVALSKCEAQLTEYRARNDFLTQLLEEKTSKSITLVTTSQEEEEQLTEKSGRTSQEALQSSVKSLQKIISQKEETIARYQSLLKEDRDKHSEAATRLHEEILSLRKIAAGASNKDNAMAPSNTEQPERDLSAGEMPSAARLEETSILREKISRLETELSISAELAERWHRLAEDRLRHMDSTRERLEEQHREEVDSYRVELNKRQREVDGLRRQLSENRRAPSTKEDVLTFMQTLEIKDNRLTDEIENKLEERAAVVSSRQFPMTHEAEDSRIFEFEQTQSQLDNLRKQLQASMERERSHKTEIAELQQRMSRRYMAVKAQEKKASRREMQLEKKVKELEEELHEAKELLDRQFSVQQAKRAKTAEDLALWEKLKKWQSLAERSKEKLKEKTDECQRLQGNYEKLRALISCMEREKWFLRGKCGRTDGLPVSAWMPPPSPENQSSNHNNDLLVEKLQRECRELRERVNELVSRLSRQEEERKRAAATADFEDEVYIEKENVRLEAENFELRLELERANGNAPRYQEKIQHLEKYVELLKSEKSLEPFYQSTSIPLRRDGTPRTKTELERTVVTLKKLVEKLQQENKRLKTSMTHNDLDLPTRCNCIFLREDYERAKHRIAELESELELAEKRILILEETDALKSDDDNSEEVTLLKQQLSRKAELLAKVKDLLVKAASNEKELRQRIQQLEFKQTLSIIPECASSLAIT